jgi:hypothetical protein
MLISTLATSWYGSFGPRMVCTKCGMVGADVRPNSRERRL